ncbi:hypothetical protein AURDEDRAFT_81510 [Auricularia subglabra TFB-10046 SS5]|nr:hypothetical protein AURDEDRAFT_81510 [Auricularia subglabra TFB-10046 SS5]
MASTPSARKPRGKKAKKQQSQTPIVTDPVPAPATTAAEEQQPDSAVDGATCWICAEPVRYYALSECNHRTCHVCCLRLRALYKKRECTFCKAPQPSVVQTLSPDAPYESFTSDNTPFVDEKLDIRFESQEMMEDTLLLLRFNCPDADCTFYGTGWADLKQHVRATHKKSMCHICIGAKKIFAHEHTLYTNAELAIHVPSIRRREKMPQGASLDVEGGVHPLCEFCNECFFSDEELYPHMRDRHEKCFVCEREGRKFNYFRNYEELEAHFSNAHYPCSHPTCREQKFVVFGTQMDLKAHTIEAHGADLSSKDKRDARRVLATSDFGFQPPAQATAGSGSRRRNGFGAQLTLERSETATPSALVPPQPQLRREEPPENLEPAQAAQQAAFLARFTPGAAMAMHASMRSFRASECSARDVISTLWNVLERELDATGSHVAALVDAFPDEKRAELLQSWNDFKLEQRREFPDLMPRQAQQGTEYAGIAAGRVLNVKHTTARSGAQSRRVWDRVAQAAASTSAPTPGPSSSARPQQDNRFPALSTAASGRAGGGHHTPWIAAAPAAPPPAQAFRPPAPSPAPTSSARPPDPKPRKAPQLSNAAFPSLPSSGTSTAQSLRQQGFLSGNASVRNIVGANPGPTAAAWGAKGGSATQNEANASTSTAAAADASVDGGGGGGGKGKKKGKQKQTLFTLGAFSAV